MFTVVEHDETVELAEAHGEGVDDRAPELLAEAEHLSELRSDALGITERCELDTPHAVGNTADFGPRHLVCQSALAASARARDRQQSLCADLRAERIDLGATADETRQRQRQVGPLVNLVADRVIDAIIRERGGHDRF